MYDHAFADPHISDEVHVHCLLISSPPLVPPDRYLALSLSRSVFLITPGNGTGM